MAASVWRMGAVTMPWMTRRRAGAILWAGQMASTGSIISRLTSRVLTKILVVNILVFLVLKIFYSGK